MTSTAYTTFLIKHRPNIAKCNIALVRKRCQYIWDLPSVQIRRARPTVCGLIGSTANRKDPNDRHRLRSNSWPLWPDYYFGVKSAREIISNHDCHSHVLQNWCTTTPAHGQAGADAQIMFYVLSIFYSFLCPWKDNNSVRELHRDVSYFTQDIVS